MLIKGNPIMKKLIFVIILLPLLLSCSAKTNRPIAEGLATGIISAGETSTTSILKTSAQTQLAGGVLFEFIPWLLKDRSERPTRGTQSYEIMEEGESIRD